MILPEPECPYGYPHQQVEDIVGDRSPAFWKWMSGQTMMLCDGREYDYATKEYVETGHAHGGIVYASDLRTFLAGWRPID